MNLPSSVYSASFSIKYGYSALYAFLNPKTVSINNLITLITNEYYERNRGLKKSTYGNGLCIFCFIFHKIWIFGTFNIEFKINAKCWTV